MPIEVKNKKGVAKVLDIIKMIGKQCTEKFISNSTDADEIKHNYNQYIDIVKTGFSNTI